MIRSLLTSFSIFFVYAARFASYFDAECKNKIVNTLAFIDVCTWSSNTLSGSFSLSLSACSESELEIRAFNLTDFPQCQGTSPYTLSVNTSCMPYDGHYIQAYDFTCESLNTTYNILAHFTSDCQDGGYAFSVQLGEGTCQGDSFAPGLFDWDVQGSYSDPFYSMDVFESKNGTCRNQTVSFETKQFPAYCLAPSQNFHNIALDIYPAFPAVTAI